MQHLWKIMAAGLGLAASPAALAQGYFTPGNIVVTQLGDGSYPLKSMDLSQDLTAQVFLDQFTTTGGFVNQLALPTTDSGSNHGLVTSGGSKSEGALNLSADGRYLTYLGYGTSNLGGNVIGIPDISKVPGSFSAGSDGPNVEVARVIARIDGSGGINTTTALTDAYQGDNPRAAVTVNGSQFYTVGNSDNETTVDPVAGVVPFQTIGVREAALGATTSTLLGTVGALAGNPAGATGTKADNATPSKADNFRGITYNPYDGNIYVSKGSGGKGSNGVFEVTKPYGTGETTNPTNPNNIKPLFYQTSTNPTPNATYYPFGIFFANATTMYVADEGLSNQIDLTSPMTIQATAAPTLYAGLQKWSLLNGSWMLDYTLKNGLDLGAYKDIGGVMSATEGLRGLAGKVNADGTASLFAITGQTDANPNTGDGDPDQLVSITDSIGASSLPSNEAFSVLGVSPAGTVYRGVAFAPRAAAVPEPSSLALLLLPLAGLGLAARRRQATSRA